MSGWIEQVDARGVHDIATHIGFKVKAAHFGPCPSCGEDRRSRSDARPGAIFVVNGNKGWKCGVCGVGGGPLKLATLRIMGDALQKGDPRWAELRATLAGLGLCDAAERGPAARKLAPILPPPAEDVADLPRPESAGMMWELAVAGWRDPEVRAWLQSRGLDPERVGGLVRVASGPLPRWASVRVDDAWRPWSDGWRALLAGYDHRGEIVTLRGRWCAEGPAPGGVKSAAAAAGPGSSRNAVLANPIAVEMLQTGRPPKWWTPGEPFRLVVTEGEPDFLAWATKPYGDHEMWPAVVGVWNGSWTPEIAARVPMGTHVEIRVHHDEAGERYTRRIVETLGTRVKCLRGHP